MRAVDWKKYLVKYREIFNIYFFEYMRSVNADRILLAKYDVLGTNNYKIYFIYEVNIGDSVIPVLPSFPIALGGIPEIRLETHKANKCFIINIDKLENDDQTTFDFLKSNTQISYSCPIILYNNQLWGYIAIEYIIGNDKYRNIDTDTIFQKARLSAELAKFYIGIILFLEDKS